jgi:hypothetical protein
VLKRSEVEELGASLLRVLDAIDSGELTASGATRSRLEGALTALEAVLGEPSTLLARLGVESK